MAAGSHDSERGSFLQSPLDQICEQEQKLVELRRSKGPFDRAVRALTTNIRESYESMILENVSSLELIEHQLWQLHYGFIKEFRARLEKLKAAAVAAASVPNKKKAVEKQKFERVGGQYKCFLDEATGFYHGLIAKLGAKHGLGGKFSSPGNRTEISSSSNKRFRRFQCVCHRCYIYLGDLSRYKELHLVVEGRTPDWNVAANYYRQASALWPAGGNPYNQLGVLANYAGDNLQALYHYLYSLAVHVPFSTARTNAKLLFEKNQRHNSQLSNSPDDDVAIDIEMAQAFESHKSSPESHPECPLARLQRRFRVHFITLIGLLFNKSGLEDFPELSTLVLREAQLLLSQDNALITSFTLEKSNRFKNQAFSVMQLVVLLIFSVHNVGSKKDKSSRNSQRLEMSPVVMQATIFAFRFMTGMLQDCTRTEEPCCSPLFPAVVVFCNWLSCYPDFCQQIQGDEECEKLQCSFVKEACMLLSKCVRQVVMAKPHDNDSIAYSEKEGHHGTETILWEDKELCGIVPLKHLETSETALKLSVLAKSAHNVPESACVVRAERLMKALTFLCSVLKLDSSELDAITALSKSASGWASVRASPSERIRCSQSSGGSVRTADGSMQLKTQGPCIVQRTVENTLSSPFRKDDCPFPQARDRSSGSAGPSKLASLSCEGSHQSKVISERELKVTRFSEASALQQPESEPCDNNVEGILEDPVRNNVEPRDDGTLCSVGRGALSLGDWVKAPAGGDGNVDASPALEKRPKSQPGASQQAQTHSSGEESLNPSLSFKAVCGTPKRLLVPLSRNADVDDPREKEQQLDLSTVRKETDTHASVSLNRPDAAQDPIDLDCGEQNVEKDGTTLEGLDSSKSRKRKHLSDEPLKGSSPDTSLGYDAIHESEEANLEVDSRKSKKQKHSSHEPSKGSSPESPKGHEAGHQSEEDGTREDGAGVDIEPGKQNPLATSLEEVRCIAHDTRTKELNNSSQLMFGHAVQSSPDHGVASNQLVADGTVQQAPANLDNQEIVSSTGTRRIGLEDVCPTISGRGKKRKHEAAPPQARSTLPSMRCQNCQCTNPGEGPSERVNGAAPQIRTCRDEDAGFSSQLGQGSCKEQTPCSSQGSGMESPFKRPRLKEWNCEEFDNWFSHAVPQAFNKVASAMRKASFVLSDLGGFLEFGAKVNAAKINLGFGAHHEHPSCRDS